MFYSFFAAHNVYLGYIFAFFAAVLSTMLFERKFIPFLKLKFAYGQPIREDGPQSHILNKSGTPTMGGAGIIFGILTAVLLFCDLKSLMLWRSLGVLCTFAGIGIVDDLAKLTKNDYHGLRAKSKFLLQIAACWIFLLITCENSVWDTTVYFVKTCCYVNLNWAFFIWSAFIIIGSSNAVNLTDGLDGLAVGPIMICSAFLLVIGVIEGNAELAKLFNIPFVMHGHEIAGVLSAVIGACLGFLWFNAYPAQIFMGDVGAEGLGAFLGFVSLSLKQEVLFGVVGGIFIVETVSVILQVAWFKKCRRRLFLMTPIHHHFEQKGIREPQIVVRAWVLTWILFAFGLCLVFL